jgi:hypothetical protein
LAPLFVEFVGIWNGENVLDAGDAPKDHRRAESTL